MDNRYPTDLELDEAYERLVRSAGVTSVQPDPPPAVPPAPADRPRPPRLVVAGGGGLGWAAAHPAGVP